jgi:LPS sulfotransferase NodH
MKGYVILTSQRSGSTYLCHLLRSTKRLGVPREYFTPGVKKHIPFDGDPDDIETRFQAVQSLGATSNGAYGVKIIAQTMQVSLQSRWPLRLPGLRLIYLERRDLLGQAISLAKAERSLQWMSWQQARNPVEYSGEQIERCLRNIINWNAMLRHWLARNDLPVSLYFYEDIVADPQSIVDAIAHSLGESEPAIVDPSLVETEIQRDEINTEWRERFCREEGKLLDLGWITK